MSERKIVKQIQAISLSDKLQLIFAKQALAESKLNPQTEFALTPVGKAFRRQLLKKFYAEAWALQDCKLNIFGEDHYELRFSNLPIAMIPLTTLLKAYRSGTWFHFKQDGDVYYKVIAYPPNFSRKALFANNCFNTMLIQSFAEGDNEVFELAYRQLPSAELAQEAAIYQELTRLTYDSSEA